jgi:hypothetical protein
MAGDLWVKMADDDAEMRCGAAIECGGAVEGEIGEGVLLGRASAMNDGGVRRADESRGEQQKGDWECRECCGKTDYLSRRVVGRSRAIGVTAGPGVLQNRVPSSV